MQKVRVFRIITLFRIRQLSRTVIIFIFRKREFETTNEALKEMTQKYDDLCHQRTQLKNNLQNTTEEKIMLERQLTQIQVSLILKNYVQFY